jgi:MoaA/NifB/PqqE/SkfB family radical SAM enzyme
MEFNFNSPTSDSSFNTLDYGLDLTNTHSANTSITIAPNGDVLAVQHQVGSAGNILRDEWDKIWYSQAFKDIRKHGLKPTASETELLTFLGTGTPLLGLK